MIDCFIIVHTQSSDEIHFIVMGMENYKRVKELSEKNDSGELIKFTNENNLGRFFVQTYNDETCNFSNKYNIQRVIYLPEFGY